MDRHFVCRSLVGVLLVIGVVAEPPSRESSTTPARELDALLQARAFAAFDGRPRTGVVYDGAVPADLAGVKVAALRLRSGSMFRRGFSGYKEFDIPTGIVVQPFVERVVLAYQNLGNWSSFYYPIDGYSYLTPVVGLLAYDAANLSATNADELQFVASKSPIILNFDNVGQVPSESVAKCVWFDLDGVQHFRELTSSNVCSTFRRGHFGIVVNATGVPSPAPSGTIPSNDNEKGSSKAWKIVVSVIGGFLGLILLALVLVCCVRHKRRKKLAKLEQRAELSEALTMASVGNTQAPVALGMRTQPTLEKEYIP